MTNYGVKIKHHCQEGQPTIKKTYTSAYMGEDWTIYCPCGHSKRYAWVHASFAIQRWNKLEVNNDPA